MRTAPGDRSVSRLTLATLAVTMLGAVASGVARAQDPPPPHAHAGQCFARATAPARYETVHERVLVAPGRVDTRVIPAVFRDESRPVVIEPERRERFTVAAVCHDVTEPVVVRPAGVRVEVVPAEFRDIPESVMVAPARRYWKRSDAVSAYGPGWSGATQVTPTGEIVCLVEDPPVYRTEMRRVMVAPERRVEVPVPELVQWMSRRVVDVPAHVEERVTPERVEYRNERVMVAPERVERVDVAPVFRDVERQVLAQPARTSWVEVACARPPPPCPTACDRAVEPPPPPARYRSPCAAVACSGAPIRPPGRVGWRREEPAEAAANPVAQMQRALRARGFYRGAPTGLMDPESVAALHRFQRDRGLEVGPLTAQSAEALELR